MSKLHAPFRQAEVGASQTMIERTEAGERPHRAAGFLFIAKITSFDRLERAGAIVGSKGK